jgi:hypothetical protein
MDYIMGKTNEVLWKAHIVSVFWEENETSQMMEI